MTTGRLLCALAVASPSLSAQSLADVCKAVATAKVGEWASYDATGGSSGGKLRFAIVGSERAGDSTLYWFEMSFAGTDPTHTGIVQILTSSLSAGAAGTRAVIFKAGGQPAMKVSGQMAGAMGKGAGRNNSASDWGARCAAAHVVGWESVTVPAGTFHALHVRLDDGGEAWASPDVPFGLVKTRAKEGDLVLTGRGADAKSSITETPQEMPMLPGLKKP
ncbi:MAG TPA: hypothetical protein VEU74_09240 [Gemmatimonadales bacterium]|nr:hypothetical protein [Gemmatimonadales bacterium]